MNNLNISIIKYFIKVAKLKSISNAAEELYITQPTLSRQIASLEDALGVKLLRRLRKGVELTPEGTAFYEQCKNLVAAYEEFTAKAFEFRNIVAGTLNIGYQAPSKEFIVRFNSIALKHFPHIEIHSFRQSKDNFLDEMISGNLDFAYIYGNELKHYGNISSIHIGSWHKMVLVSCDSPLAKRDSIHISELKKEKFVATTRAIAPVKTEELFGACKQHGFMPNIVRYADTFYDILIDVVTYGTISVLPCWNDTESLENKVKYIKLEGLETEYPIHLAWMPTNPNPVLSTYIQQVKLALNETLA